MNKRNPNRQGSIYYSESKKKWTAEIRWVDKNGKSHRKAFSGKTKILVKNKLDDFKRQLIIAEGQTKEESISFEEYAAAWLKTEKLILKPSSYARKESSLVNQVYPYLGGIPIDDISHSDIQNMVNSLSEKGLSYSTIKKAYEAVSGCLRNHRIKTSSSFNPAEGVKLPENTKKDISNITFFNEEQRELIKAEALRSYKTGRSVYRLGHAIIVLMYTGMRLGELIALTWDDVDFENKTITINKNALVAKIEEDGRARYKLINQNSTKTGSGSRIIPMTIAAKASLEEIKKFNGNKKYVLSSSTGNQVSPRNIEEIFGSILKRTGLDSMVSNQGVHSLRHTFASMLFQNGCEVKVVSEILGHANTKITENIYIHVIQEQKVKAIQNIDKYSS